MKTLEQQLQKLKQYPPLPLSVNKRLLLFGFGTSFAVGLVIIAGLHLLYKFINFCNERAPAPTETKKTFHSEPPKPTPNVIRKEFINFCNERAPAPTETKKTFHSEPPKPTPNVIRKEDELLHHLWPSYKNHFNSLFRSDKYAENQPQTLEATIRSTFNDIEHWYRNPNDANEEKITALLNQSEQYGYFGTVIRSHLRTIKDLRTEHTLYDPPPSDEIIQQPNISRATLTRVLHSLLFFTVYTNFEGYLIPETNKFCVYRKSTAHAFVALKQQQDNTYYFALHQLAEAKEINQKLLDELTLAPQTPLTEQRKHWHDHLARKHTLYTNILTIQPTTEKTDTQPTLITTALTPEEKDTYFEVYTAFGEPDPTFKKLKP